MLLQVLICCMLLSGCVHDSAVAPADPIAVVPEDTSGNGAGTDGGTGETNTDPCDPDSVYFETDILPILISNCAKSGCHDAASHQDGVNLTSYEKVMSTADVEPFDLDGGKLYEAITDSDPDDRMPPPPNTSLTGDQVALIAKWIQQGALNITCNANGSGCDTSNVTYSGTVSSILQTYCVGCHGSAAPSGGIVLSQYNGVAAVALSGQLVGAITHSPGYTAMPLGGNKLPSCEIEQITKWVNDGATNN
ncbi:MAG: cytochrome c [Chitinophagales bacterium]